MRGNNRSDLFVDDNDRTVFLRYLRHAIETTHSSVHAFVLMTNHVHLLASGELTGSLSSLVQSVGRRYAYYINRVYDRTGSLFEGRFSSSLVGSERYLFSCMRYIELNPVRAGIVVHPGDYPWSSYRRNTGRDEYTWLVPTDEYLSLGSDPVERAEAYRSLFARPLEAGELAAIRECARKGCPFGSQGFVARTEQVLGRPARTRPQGRPRKPEQEKGI